MHNLGDDNELDRLSRDAARKYDTPGKANWKNLQEELDKVLPVEKNPWSFLFWLLPVLLIAGASYWLLTKKSISTTGAENIVAGKIDTTHSNQAQPSSNKAGIVTKENNTQNNIAPPAVKENLLGVNNLSVQKSIARKREKKNSQYTYHSSAVGLEKTRTVQSSVLTKPPTKETVQKTPEPNNSVGTDKKNNSAPTKETATENNVSKEINTTIQTKEKSDAVTVQSEKQSVPTTSTYIKTSLPSFGKGWSVAFLAGFDKSTVKFRYGNDPGINIGIIGGYHFNNRLSIHTGAIYTQKNYKLSGEDFTSPKGSWLSYYKLENVDGYCRMWEVPLMLRYAISHANKNSYFISAGLSSYFMSTENYNYFYYNSQGQPVTKNAAYFSGNKYILSILHLSAGFENRISKNLSLQIEPYAKLPLVGVGFGNIQLSSFGINFALQSRQVLKK